MRGSRRKDDPFVLIFVYGEYNAGRTDKWHKRKVG